MRLGNQRSKYGAVKTLGYASRGEAARAAELRMLASGGAISDYREQVVLDVNPDGCEPIRYRADFRYEQDGLTVVEDFKGIETPEFRIKWKLARWKYPACLFRLSYRHGRGFELKDYPPKEIA